MKFRTLLLTSAALLVTPAIIAADKTIRFELRVPIAVDCTHAGVELVGEHTSQSCPLLQTKQTVDGKTNIFQHFFTIDNSYRGRGIALMVWPDASPCSTSEVFVLPITYNQKAMDWSKWHRPDFTENFKNARNNFMEGVTSPDRSTNVPPNTFELRYKIEDSN